MKRDELDAWFAKADDILTEWRGSEDSARSTDDDLTDDKFTARVDQLQRAVMRQSLCLYWIDATGVRHDIPPPHPRRRDPDPLAVVYDEWTRVTS